MSSRHRVSTPYFVEKKKLEKEKQFKWDNKMLTNKYNEIQEELDRSS